MMRLITAKAAPWLLLGAITAMAGAWYSGYRVGADRAAERCERGRQVEIIERIEYRDRLVEIERPIIRTVVEERERIREVIRHVEREPVDTPECADLGPDWIGLHNKAARVASGAAD